MINSNLFHAPGTDVIVAAAFAPFAAGQMALRPAVVPFVHGAYVSYWYLDNFALVQHHDESSLFGIYSMHQLALKYAYLKILLILENHNFSFPYCLFSPIYS